MHPYGIDTNERRNALIVLVPISFWLSAGILRLLDETKLSLPSNLDWMFDATSAAFWFGLLYALLESWGWKWRWLRKLLRIHTPDLNGDWAGELRSSYADPEKGIEPFENPVKADVTIRQSWTRIVVELTTDQSSSRSGTASIFLEAGVNPMIVYTYVNRPNPDQVETMAMHSGTTELYLVSRDGKTSLDGTYYSGRGRGNHGSMAVTKKPKALGTITG